MKKRLLLLLVFVAVLSNLMGFDGNRKGFILGFGAGASLSSYRQEAEYNGQTDKTDTSNDTGFATDFKIGYALSNKLELYYSNQVAWFSFDQGEGSSVNIANGLSTLSASYFLSKKLNDGNWHPSPFINGGVGLSSWSAPQEDYSIDAEGQGIFIGIGYEFAKHFRVSLNCFASDPSFKFFGANFTTYTKTYMLTVSGMAF